MPSGGTVGTIVASGEAEIGFQQVSELVHIPGIDYIGPLPADVQCVTVFSCGLQTGAPKPDAAKALVAFLTTPAAEAVMTKAWAGDGLTAPSAALSGRAPRLLPQEQFCWENCYTVEEIDQ